MISQTIDRFIDMNEVRKERRPERVLSTAVSITLTLHELYTLTTFDSTVHHLHLKLSLSSFTVNASNKQKSFQFQYRIFFFLAFFFCLSLPLVTEP